MITKFEKPIYVTQPFLPPLNEFNSYLEKIWHSKILTNCGPFHQEFEDELRKYLGVKYLSLFANGTIALVTALQSLRITGEVITTPFSFVATSHALLWNGVKPVFVDIDENTLNINAELIEAAITPHTTAILPVHCYGHPCEIDKIQKIADNYNLKVIYDAAHAFGVSDNSGSILRHGDLSILSFHATKVFNTFEGGAIICPDEKTKIRIDQLKNFGHIGETTVVASGINGKMSEINSVMGLLQLKYINQAIRSREKLDQLYRELLKNVKGIICIGNSGEKVSNFAYFPIIISDEYPLTRDELKQYLNSYNIFPRRYFYPLISEFPMYRGLSSSNSSNLRVAFDKSRRILCLPLYPQLGAQAVEVISSLISNPK